MEILIFSDSHGHVEGMQRALQRQVKRSDMILHLGDGAGDLEYLRSRGIPTVAVRGNCDWFTAVGHLPEVFAFEELGHKILMTHGHAFGVKGGTGALLSYAAREGADIVLFGHTHVAHEECIAAGEELGGVTLTRPLYVFNPGSIGVRGGMSASLSFGTLSLTRETVLFSHGVI